MYLAILYMIVTALLVANLIWQEVKERRLIKKEKEWNDKHCRKAGS